MEPKHETVVGAVVDFTESRLGPYREGHLDYYRWPEDMRRQAASLSQVNIETDATSGKQALRVRILRPLPFEYGAVPLLRFAPFYPPEVDALRLRIKILSGEVRAFVGGPTAYYANSDAYSRTERLKAGDVPRWITCDFSLNHPLRRNDRRAGLSTDAARIYYNRWAQEPNGLYLAAGTHGEFLVERIDAVAYGEGRPFPQFADAEVRTVKTIADFEDGRHEQAFHLYMADREVEWFEHSWKRDRPLRFAPPELTVGTGSESGTKSLVCVGPSAEEVHCTGVHAPGAIEANAIRVTLRHEAPEYRNTVVGLGRAEAIDFFVFAAPKKQPFPWSTFAANDELRSHGGPGFDYQFSYQVIRNRQDADFAVYQTRRYLRPGEWTTLVMPILDFVCIYGSGAYRTRLTENQPTSCEDAIAVAWLNPWCRSGNGRSDVRLSIDELAWVHVPGMAEQHRSFWQTSPSSNARLLEVPEGRNRTRWMLLPGDAEPDAE